MATITFRTSTAVDQALGELMTGGRDRSQAIREAILTARNVKEAALLHAEAEGLTADDADVAEARAVLSDMAALRAW